MFVRNGRCNFFDIRNQENRQVRFVTQSSLAKEYPPQAFLAISSGPLTGIPLLGANVWEISCYNSSHAQTGHSVGTGPFGTILRLAGFDQVILFGTCPTPSYLLINEEGCHIRPLPYGDSPERQSFDRQIKGITGDTPYELLIVTDTGIATSGLMAEDSEVSDFLARRNIGAIVVEGKGRIAVAEPEELLNKSLAISKKWRQTGLPGGHSGCFSCHGHCRSFSGEGTGVMSKEQRDLFIALGICPQVLLHGVVISPGDLVDFLQYATGEQYTEQELWDFSRTRGGLLNEC